MKVGYMYNKNEPPKDQPMNIRFATLDDIQPFVKLGKEFHSMTRFHVYPYDEARVAKQLRAIIGQKEGVRSKLLTFLL